VEPNITKVNEDARGAIYSIELPDNRELMLLFSKAGVFRGGHSHDCDEVVYVQSGSMKYYKLADGWEDGKLLTEGMFSFNAAGVIHMGEFLEDSWVIESKHAEKDAWTQTDWEPYRKMVRESME